MRNIVKGDKFDVIGLEARDRVGGRVFTDPEGNEIGGAWIHGVERVREDGFGTVEANPIYEMAKEFIPEADLYPTMDFYAVHSDGSHLDSDSSIWHAMWIVLNKIKTSQESVNNAFKKTDVSVYDYIVRNWSDLMFEVGGFSEKAVLKCCIEWQSYYATYWETTSVGCMAVDREFEGDQLLIKNGGYTRILNRYLDHYGLRDKISLNSPVSKIERLESGKTRVHYGSDGRFEDADVVVVTVPLGVLKAKSIEFIPPLPESKQQSIDRLGFGVYDKVFVTFTEPIEEFEGRGFWPSHADVVSVVPKANDDYNAYLREVKPQENSGTEPRRPYRQRDPGHIGIEMANISDVVGVPKVVMLIYEDGAREMESLAHDSEMLTEFARSKLVNAFPGKTIPEIKEVKATCWGSDPYALGSFANIPVGASGMDMLNIAEPVDGRIFFAGEASFPLHYSTIHGAFKSGVREYARLMDQFYPDEENEYRVMLTDHTFWHFLRTILKR